MNNQVQQRFDRSIREAVAMTKAARASKNAEDKRIAQARAARFLPGVENALTTATGLRREALMDLRARYRKTLGLPVDRGMRGGAA